MTIAIIMLGLYFCFVKSMDWKLRFYIAAPLFVVTETAFQYTLSSAYLGRHVPLDVRLILIQLIIFLGVFYVLERIQDTDATFLWSAVWLIGAAALLLAR